MATGLQGWPWVTLDAWAREGREGKFMSCSAAGEGGGEKRRMVSERLFANRASVNVEAQTNKGIDSVERAAHG